jgi:hypothetical protein
MSETKVEPIMDGQIDQPQAKPVVDQSTKKTLLDGILNASLPMVWGAFGAGLVVFAMNQFKPEEVPPLKLATVDISKIMQEFHERVLRNPNDQTAVNFALEESGRAAQAVDPLLKYLSTELHPGYTIIQPQALAYQGDIPDFTDEFRVLVQKRMGKFNKGLETFAPDPVAPATGNAVMSEPVAPLSPVPQPELPELPLKPTVEVKPDGKPDAAKP